MQQACSERPNVTSFLSFSLTGICINAWYSPTSSAENDFDTLFDLTLRAPEIAAQDARLTYRPLLGLIERFFLRAIRCRTKK